MAQRPPPAVSRESTAAAYVDPFIRPAITTEQLYARYAPHPVIATNTNHYNRNNIFQHPLPAIINHPLDRYRYANGDILLNDNDDNDDDGYADNRLDSGDNIGSDGWDDAVATDLMDGVGYVNSFEPMPPSIDYYADNAMRRNELVQEQCMQRLRKLAQLF